MSRDDREAVAELLGRVPQGPFEVIVRDASGNPVVIVNAPLLDDGTPMPTRYWLVGRREREAVSRLESTGGVKAAEAAVDPSDVAAAHLRYAAERDAALPAAQQGPRPSGGVGGTRRGVKCLHAHLAWWLAGADDPVGCWTAEQLSIDRSSYSLEQPSPAPPPSRSPLTAAACPAEIPARVAAVDCGTNSTRLLVVDATLRPLARLMRITRLGQDVDRTGRLAKDAIRRTVEVLVEFRQVMDTLGVRTLRATATSAARDAANAAEFSAEVHAVLGVEPEVLSGDEEGRLTFRGATSGLDPDDGPYLVIDVGGGSTELVSRGADDVFGVSMDIGCVRATERFLVSDPPRADEIATLRGFVRGLVAAAIEARPALGRARRLVGVAGTVAALTSLDQGLVEYDRSRIHHARLRRDTTERLLEELASEPVEQRRRRPGLEPDRADVIVGGAAVLAEAMATLGFDELLASESDILDGIAAELLTAAPLAAD